MLEPSDRIGSFVAPSALRRKVYDIYKRRLILKGLFGLALALALIMFGKTPFWAQFQLEGKRHPQYAGSWYEADPDKLNVQLGDYLKNAAAPDAASVAKLTEKNAAVSTPVTAIISPHAGYMFSGQTAAFGFDAISHQRPQRVFLLGPSHHVGFRGAAVPLAVTFSTPLGDLQVDKEIVDELRSYPGFSTQPEVHKVEHSLEMQLPYIRKVFGDVKIVPIIIGHLDDEGDARLIAEILKGFVAKGDVVVVSSDFTHYGPRYDYKPFTDNIKENIRKLDKEAYSHINKIDVDGFVEFQKRTGDTICGMHPCAVLISMLPPGSRASLLKYATSQDVHPDEKENSVSYMSIAFSGTDWPEHPGEVKSAKELVKLSPKERDDLLKLARATVDTYVKEERVPKPEELGIEITAIMKSCFGVFVTLNKKGLPEREALRGCIGTIYPMRPLYRGVQENAVAASTRDRRFQPVSASELAGLDVHINILTPPRRVGSYKNIVLGRDGIILSKYGHQAVFLPKVPGEFGWTLEETLTQLSLKAGLKGDDWKEGAKYDVFQSEELP